jgi:hypothetical protein
VIVHDWGALPECVEQSGGGFTYRTQQELVSAMERLQHNPSLRCELGERGYQGFLRWWSTEPHLDAYFAAIEEATELRRGREGLCASRS